MLGIIIGILGILGMIGAGIGSIAKTPDHLQGYYGAMFWTIAIVAIIVIVVIAALGLL